MEHAKRVTLTSLPKLTAVSKRPAMPEIGHRLIANGRANREDTENALKRSSMLLRRRSKHGCVSVTKPCCRRRFDLHVRESSISLRAQGGAIMTSHGILERLLAVSKAQNFATSQDVDLEGLHGVPPNEKAQNRAAIE